MIFDTDVLIWTARGNVKASKAIENSPKRQISTQTYLELLQCATDKRQQSLTRSFLRGFAFEVLPLTSGIGVRSCALIEQFALSHNLRVGDAIIAATAKTVEVASGGDIAAAVVEAHSDGNAGAVHLRGEYAVMRRTSGCLVIRENP